MEIYDQLFALQQSIETEGAEQQKELVWGIGIARWAHPAVTFDIPILHKRVGMEIDEETGAICIRPRQMGVELNSAPFERHELAGCQAAVRGARHDLEDLGKHGEEVSPFVRTTFDHILRHFANALDPQGSYVSDTWKGPADRSPPKAGDHLQISSRSVPSAP